MAKIQFTIVGPYAAQAAYSISRLREIAEFREIENSIAAINPNITLRIGDNAAVDALGIAAFAAGLTRQGGI